MDKFFQEQCVDLNKKIKGYVEAGEITKEQLKEVKGDLDKIKYAVMNSVYSSEEAIEYTIESYKKIIEDLNKILKEEEDVLSVSETVTDTPVKKKKTVKAKE